MICGFEEEEDAEGDILIYNWASLCKVLGLREQYEIFLRAVEKFIIMVVPIWDVSA